MAQLSKIGWCDHTHNHWIGCAKVSSGCTHCYAERDIASSQRFYGTWGPKARRVLTSAANRDLPLKWNANHPWLECQECGWRGAEKKLYQTKTLFTEAKCPACQGENLEVTRQRVFSASLADVFEDRDDLVDYRADLFRLIEKTPNLIWMLLTKRPENVNRMAADYGGDCAWLGWSGTQPRDNIWIGASIENQAAADHRIPYLLDVWSENVLKFLSVEPMLDQLSLAYYFGCSGEGCNETPDMMWRFNGTLLEHHHGYPMGHVLANVSPFDWVIAGGESGPKARPVHPFWLRHLRDQCDYSSTPFYFKQWGEFIPHPSGDTRQLLRDIDHVHDDGQIMLRVGRETAGDELDGRTWHQFPS